jgi:serine/threonine protein kinase/tetratricopeptide (TPR) repeat protein
LALSAGSRLGPYEIVSALGSGGMGEVYRARDSRLGREVAIKVLPAELANEADRLSRFEQESRSASALNHPNIVTIYDVGRDGAVSYIAMELVEGRSLRELTAAGPLLPLRRALAIGTQIAEGLARAHAAGIVHRDLKPENVMVTEDGLVKILDFGLAKLSLREESGGDSMMTTLAGGTSPGVVLGTVGYMSPEQAVGRAVDFRSDQFPLGAILYELVTGVRAFQRPSAVETLSAILRDEPAPLAAVAPQAPEGLRWIVERCLAKEPEERYASTRDLARDLANLRDRSPQAAVAPPIPPRAEVSSARSLFPTKWALAALGLAALAAAASVFLRPHSAAPPAERSLAILPFQNLGAATDDEYFADGMTESLITDVAKSKGLVVIARNSVFAYKGRPVDLRKVARELGVRYVLEGSVQRAGGAVRINAQLVDAATGQHLWAEKYDRPLTDIFALQDDISNRIAGSLEIALGSKSSRETSRRTGNVDAYDAYLRGVSHTHGLERSDLAASIAMFERAVALDPGFAAAHAALGSVYARKFFDEDPSREWEEKAGSEIRQALSLDPDLPEAWVARGNLEWTLANGFPHEAAVADFRRALRINPSLADARRFLGRVYYHVGLFDKALEEFQQALRVDPNDEWVVSRIGNVYLYQGEYEKAVTQYDKVPKLQTAGERLLALSYLGRQDEALAAAEGRIAENAADYDVLAVEAIFLARKGDRAGAERAIGRTIEAGKGLGHFHHDEYWIGCAYALMKDEKKAMEWLEKAVGDGFPCYPLFQGDRYLDSLRGNPEFQALLLRMKNRWGRYRATL